jgi:hypothetical protein
MSASAKASKIAKQLAAELDLRTTLTVSESTDTDGSPLIRVGAASAGAAGALIRVTNQEWSLAKDILGNTANHFSPHIVQVCFEANPAGGAGADVSSLAQIALILGCCFARGARTEVYASSNGDNPDADDFVEAKLVLTFDPSLVDGMIANQ